MHAMSSRETPSRLGSRNALQLGTFGTNLEGGPTLTLIDERLPISWPAQAEVARAADAMGLEAIVSVARWRGFGGPHNPQGKTFDTFAWAAGIGSVTERAHVFTTCHLPTLHPVVAAKQLTTIDHISGGRAGINTVGGWFRPELEMFGASMREHDNRYEHAEEWTQVLIDLWTSEQPVDFEGATLRVTGGVSSPKPLQSPHPPIMNAGTSRRGREYAARYADLAFMRITGEDLEAERAQIAEVKTMAAAHGRAIEAWSLGYVVCRDTEAEALEYLRWYADEHGDWEGATRALGLMNVESSAFSEQSWRAARRSFIAGAGGFSLVGTPETITERLLALASIGLDGCLLICADWLPELAGVRDRILPLMEQAGLREPAGVLAGASR
jgi:FMNH2-dependent dimethyl sulfone monooxygenase